MTNVSIWRQYIINKINNIVLNNRKCLLYETVNALYDAGIFLYLFDLKVII